MIRVCVAFLCLSATAAVAAAGPLPKVAIVTSAGTIVAVLEAKRAPITTANFLRYVDAHRFDGTTFYRAARSKSVPGNGLVQGGIDHDIPKTFLPIKHEPTSKTGLRHTNGTLSMARNEVGSAMGDFFITLGPAPDLDAHGFLCGLCRLRPCHQRHGRGKTHPRAADLPRRLRRNDDRPEPAPACEDHDRQTREVTRYGGDQQPQSTRIFVATPDLVIVAGPQATSLRSLAKGLRPSQRCMLAASAGSPETITPFRSIASRTVSSPIQTAVIVRRSAET